MKNKIILMLLIAGLIITYKVGMDNRNTVNTTSARAPVIETNEADFDNDRPGSADSEYVNLNFINDNKSSAIESKQPSSNDLGSDVGRERSESTVISNQSVEPSRKPVQLNTRKKPTLLEQVKEHKVKKGDTLWSIAREHGIDIDTLIGANDINNMNKIKPGEMIKILPVKGIMYRIGPGENLSLIASKFEISVQQIVESNQIQDKDRVYPGIMLILPGAKPEFGYQDRLEKLLIKPINARLSSKFGKRWGRMHEGLDFAAPVGTIVRAAGDGKVIYSGWVRGYGNTIIIEHQKGLRTLYAHNSKLLTSSGERVSRGEVISKSGNTGTTTGPNMHFEVQVNGLPVNPLNYLR